MSDTILVVVKSVTHSVKAAPTSRMRISKALYDEEMALAKQQKREPKYFAEPDQACEGMTGAELQAAQKKRRAEVAAKIIDKSATELAAV